MKNIVERIDTYETEELVHNAQMSYGDMDKMQEYMEEMGIQLINKETNFQCFITAVEDSVSEDEFKKILNLYCEYMNIYAGRFTTDEMSEKFVKEGFQKLNFVLVDAEFADKAIDNGRDVYAIKAGEIFKLDKAGAASEYESKEYLIAVTPFTYEAEFMEDIDSYIED